MPIINVWNPYVPSRAWTNLNDEMGRTSMQRRNSGNWIWSNFVSQFHSHYEVGLSTPCTECSIRVLAMAWFGHTATDTQQCARRWVLLLKPRDFHTGASKIRKCQGHPLGRDTRGRPVLAWLDPRSYGAFIKTSQIWCERIEVFIHDIAHHHFTGVLS